MGFSSPFSFAVPHPTARDEREADKRSQLQWEGSFNQKTQLGLLEVGWKLRLGKSPPQLACSPAVLNSSRKESPEARMPSWRLCHPGQIKLLLVKRAADSQVLYKGGKKSLRKRRDICLGLLRKKENDSMQHNKMRVWQQRTGGLEETDKFWFCSPSIK